jgi:ribosome-associated heat shock protein Hsp15
MEARRHAGGRLDAVSSGEADDRVRIDKWLWAARFFKTRTLATEAVEGGKVHVNGDRVKAARPLKLGDRLEIRREQELFEVHVTGMADHRGSATVAQTLYKETVASVARRQALADQRRQAPPPPPPRFKGRPDKKTRRDIDRQRRGR